MNALLHRIVSVLGYEIRRREDDVFRANRSGSGLFPFISKTEGMITYEEADLLYRHAKSVKKDCIVEIGSYRGRSAVALARGSLDGAKLPVFAIDPHEEFHGVFGGEFGAADRGAFFKAMIDTDCYHVVRLINMRSDEIVESWSRPVELLFVDGDHSYEMVKSDVELWTQHLSPNAILILDDATNRGSGPYQVVQSLIGQKGFEEIERVGKMFALRKAR